MFWADRIATEIEETFKEKIARGEPLVIRDEKTASGRVHIGSLRGVAIHGIISEVLNEKGINNRYLYEINDFDPMDGLPVYLNKAEYEKYLGMPLCNVPSPDGKAKNFAEYFAEEFIEVIKEAGFEPEYYRSSELYKSGKFNDLIRTALLHGKEIKEIYKRVSGSEKDDEWLPINVICEKCGKVSTTQAISFDGEKVSYKCADLDWTKGCGHSGAVSPFDGNAKLPWKVEWAAKFTVLNVDIEGAGKDHSTKGGSRNIADEISEKIFMRKPPFNIPYEFLLVGGKKMSSSKGLGSSAREIADLLPQNMLRFLLLQKEPQRVIDFIPDGDTIPLLYDSYDSFAPHYFKKENDDYARTFLAIHEPHSRKKLEDHYLPRFSQIAYLVQMPHVDIYSEIQKVSEKPELDKHDRAEIDSRANYAKLWLEKCAPEDYKFEIQKTVPAAVKNFSAKQKELLAQVLEYVKSEKVLEGQTLHTKLHEIRKASDLPAQDFFSALYISFLGKEKGPKAGWFFSVFDKKFLEERLSEVIK